MSRVNGIDIFIAFGDFSGQMSEITDKKRAFER
jgi:hypothetical protein